MSYAGITDYPEDYDVPVEYNSYLVVDAQRKVIDRIMDRYGYKCVGIVIDGLDVIASFADGKTYRISYGGKLKRLT